MTALHSTAQKELQRIVDQIERLDQERKALSADIKDKMAEAKSKGFDTAILRKVLALRKLGDAERSEQEAIIATYCHALGMPSLPGPMGKYVEQQRESEMAEAAH